jgi:hypothetical protein
MEKLFLTTFVLLSLVFVSQAQTKHTIGEKFGGGIVFDVSADGLHGLIAETVDQGQCIWEDAKKLIANPEKHSKAGKIFTDWRLPSCLEINKLYLQKNIVGGFTNNSYWSSTEGAKDTACCQSFESDLLVKDDKYEKNYVRTVRAF